MLTLAMYLKLCLTITNNALMLLVKYNMSVFLASYNALYKSSSTFVLYLYMKIMKYKEYV